MYNYVQRVFVGKASGAASTTQTAGQQLNLATVVVGDLYLIDDNGLVLDAAGAAVATSARVVRGVAPGKIITSSHIKRGGSSTKYTFEAYAAPIAQVTTFADLGLQPNQEYKLQVLIQQDLATIANRQDRIEVSVRTGATVGVADINKLVANFNKQRGTLNVITASAAGTTGITLTGKTIPTVGIADYEFVRFEANFVTLTATNTVTGKVENLIYPTAINPSSETKSQGGKGVAVQVRQLERIALGYQGFNDLTNTWYRPGPSFGAVDGVGYDIYNVQQLLTYPGGYIQDSRTQPVSTLVAVATGSAQKTAFGAVLDSFMQGVSPATVVGE